MWTEIKAIQWKIFPAAMRTEKHQWKSKPHGEQLCIRLQHYLARQQGLKCKNKRCKERKKHKNKTGPCKQNSFVLLLCESNMQKQSLVMLISKMKIITFYNNQQLLTSQPSSKMKHVIMCTYICMLVEIHTSYITSSTTHHTKKKWQLSEILLQKIFSWQALSNWNTPTQTPQITRKIISILANISTTLKCLWVYKKYFKKKKNQHGFLLWQEC